MEFTEQYWKDYTIFINEVEQISGISPSKLLEAYRSIAEDFENSTLLQELANWEEDEIDIERDEIVNAIQSVHKIIDSDCLRGNLVHIDWVKNALELDEQIQKHIKPEFLINKQWITNFRFMMLKATP